MKTGHKNQTRLCTSNVRESHVLRPLRVIGKPSVSYVLRTSLQET